MLKVYDYLGELIEWRSRREQFTRPPLSRFASEIREMLNMDDDAEFEEALKRSFQTLQSLNIPLERNFKKVYRSQGDQFIADWKVSPLASYLIIINCNPQHQTVARAQLFFLMTQQ